MCSCQHNAAHHDSEHMCLLELLALQHLDGPVHAELAIVEVHLEAAVQLKKN